MTQPFLLELGLLGPAGAISLVGLAAAAMVCLLAVRGEIELALVALIVSGIADLFDGFVARRRSRSERQARFGRAIDGIVDMPSFGLAPVVLVAASDASWYFVPVALAFVLCAALRLAYFDVVGIVQRGGWECYLGVPVTYAALVLPLAYLPAPLLDTPARGVWLSGVLALLAILFVLRVPIPKPKGAWYAIFAVLAVVVSAYWIAQRVTR